MRKVAASTSSVARTYQENPARLGVAVLPPSRMKRNAPPIECAHPAFGAPNWPIALAFSGGMRYPQTLGVMPAPLIRVTAQSPGQVRPPWSAPLRWATAPTLRNHRAQRLGFGCIVAKSQETIGWLLPERAQPRFDKFSSVCRRLAATKGFKTHH